MCNPACIEVGRERYEHEEFAGPGHDLRLREWGGIGVLRYRPE